MYLLKGLIFVFTYSFIDSIVAQNCCEKKGVEYQFLEYITLTNCDGKDAGNYTLINQFTRDGQCSLESSKLGDNNKLISGPTSSRQTNVNQLQVLATQINPSGAQSIMDTLYLVASGPLEGRYVYHRQVRLQMQYLKICSSVLGYSYINSKSDTLLISDKLDLNNLISPTGAFELFKKSCTTQCTGNSVIVGPTRIN